MQINLFSLEIITNFLLSWVFVFVIASDEVDFSPITFQVKNAEARKGGLDISLFRRLSDAHPKAVVDLRFQYRMNADIMLLSNRLIYNDRLECGSEEVARRCLKLSNGEFLDKLHVGVDMKLCVRKKCWLERVVDERYGFLLFIFPFLRITLVLTCGICLFFISVVKPFSSTQMLYPHSIHELVISYKIQPKPSLSVNLPRRFSVQE